MAYMSGHVSYVAVSCWHMRASRLVSILLLLQTRGRMTAGEIASELEVSLRTAYRDLDALGSAGVPVYADRGPAGGYQLVDGYRTRLTGLNADEAQALFLSGLAGPAAQLGLETVLAAAQLKVLAALPPELRGRAGRIRERFHMVAPGWFKGPEELPWLPSAAEAVWEGRRLHMRYRRPQGEVERLVDPLGLVLKAGIWYLVARRDGVMRTYRVSRILEATCVEEHFERPDGFDLARHWETAATEFERSLARVEITLRIAADALWDLAYAAAGAGDIRDALHTAPAPDADGWVTIRYRASSIDTAHDDLLRLGARAEVLGPPELRRRMADTVRAMAAAYASAAGLAP